MHQVFVLLSGGIDSTTCLFLKINEFFSTNNIGKISCVSIDYNQRHKKEILAAERICEIYNIPHHILKMPSIWDESNLLLSDQPLPNKSYNELTGISPTYVPFRNGLLLSAITAFAQQNIDDNDTCEIVFGAHAEDAQNWAYPDCTPEFIGAMANAIYIGSYRRVRLVTPLGWQNKSEVIKIGSTVGTPWGLTWSCYAGGDIHCGTCPTCRARKEAFKAANIADPTEYAS